MVFTVTGSYDLSEAIERFPMVIAACRQTGVSKVLIDYRDLDGEIGAAQDILYAQAVLEFYKQHRLSGGRPLGIVFLGPELKPWSDGEEIVKNEGPEVLVTIDYDEASDWLFREAPNE